MNKINLIVILKLPSVDPYYSEHCWFLFASDSTCYKHSTDAFLSFGLSFIRAQGTLLRPGFQGKLQQQRLSAETHTQQSRLVFPSCWIADTLQMSSPGLCSSGWRGRRDGALLESTHVHTRKKNQSLAAEINKGGGILKCQNC